MNYVPCLQAYSCFDSVLLTSKLAYFEKIDRLSTSLVLLKLKKKKKNKYKKAGSFYVFGKHSKSSFFFPQF